VGLAGTSYTDYYIFFVRVGLADDNQEVTIHRPLIDLNRFHINGFGVVHRVETNTIHLLPWVLVLSRLILANVICQHSCSDNWNDPII